MRRALALAAVGVTVACGYPEDEPGAGTPRDAFELFVTAVKEGDDGTADELVWPGLDRKHRSGYLRAMRDNVEPLERGFRIVVDDRVNDATAVVAAVGDSGPRPGAFASVLRREGASWFVLPQGLQLVYGVSATGGTATAVNPVIDFQVNVSGPGRLQTRLWVDGRTQRVRKADALVHRFVAPVRRISAGEHSVVAFARSGERAHAIAWTFETE